MYLHVCRPAHAEPRSRSYDPTPSEKKFPISYLSVFYRRSCYLERATARARAKKMARENLIITIPRSLWETTQQRQHDIEEPPRRKRIRLVLPLDASAGNTEPNAVSDMDTGQMNPFLHPA
jgi:hypothetical protein